MDFVEIDLKETKGEWSMSDLQSHDYYELYFLLEGTRRLFLGERIANVTAPALCVIPPFCMHKTEGGAYRRINVNVSPRVLTECEEQKLERLSASYIFKLMPRSGELILPLLESAIYTRPTPDNCGLTNAYLHVLLHLLDGECLSPLEIAASVPEKRVNATVTRVIEYVNKYYNEDFSIEMLCHKFFISKNTLCKEFRTLMSCSVIEYRTFVRISRAKELLASTEKSMEAIAEECGFSSANYFCLIFKKNVGIAPSYYRKAK